MLYGGPGPGNSIFGTRLIRSTQYWRKLNTSSGSVKFNKIRRSDKWFLFQVRGTLPTSHALNMKQTNIKLMHVRRAPKKHEVYICFIFRSMGSYWANSDQCFGKCFPLLHYYWTGLDDVVEIEIHKMHKRLC